MHEDAGLWDELEKLYASAGGDATSFRRLERGARRAGEDLRAYYRDIARDYVERLERRLSRPNSRLNEQERALLRAWIGVAPFDELRERHLVEELDGVSAAFDQLRELRTKPLSPDAIDRLTHLVETIARRAGAVGEALEVKARAREFDHLLDDREALLARVRALLFEEGEPPPSGGGL